MSLPPPALPAPGWFPDPWGDRQLRYWDGRGWTGWIAPGAPEQGPPRTFPFRAGLLGLLVLLGGFVLSILVAAVLYLVGLPDVVVVLGAALSLYGLVAWYCAEASRRYGTGSLGDDLGLRIRPIDVAIGVATWLSAVVLEVVVTVVLESLGLPLGTNSDIISDNRHQPGLFVGIALIAIVVAPVVEELFFRGLLLRSFRSRWRPAVAILGQAALFGCIHLQFGLGLGNLTLVAALTTVGATFGFVADRVGRLGPTIVGHMLFNTVAVVAVLVTTS